MSSIIFIGGDIRMLYAAEQLSLKHDCFAYGFEGLQNDYTVPILPILREIKRCDIVVLPLPVSTSPEGEYINAPYFDKPLPISIILEAVEENGTIYTGKTCKPLIELAKQHNLTLVDYFGREELAVLNAVPSAEGALEIAMQESAKTIFGSHVLITGYGRLSKVLIRYFTALGADVTVTARKYEDIAWAKISGCNGVLLDDIDTFLPSFDILINTVPADILTRERLLLLHNDCILIDLASKTGIADVELAKSAGIRVVWALSLPGKVAPITAGEIIASTIEHIMCENARGVGKCH